MYQPNIWNNELKVYDNAGLNRKGNSAIMNAL